jgi:hypothetical protein
MASPFHIFRKYQKSLLAVAGVVLMFVFVLGDPLSQYIRRSGVGQGAGEGRHPDDVAVRWNGGQLTNAEVSQLVMRRLIVNGFLRQVEYEGRYAAVQAGGEPRPLGVEMLSGAERPEQGVEQDVVQMRIFADTARAAGMSVSDENIVHYLDELGRNLVSADQIRAILARLQIGGRGANLDFVFDALREELLARNYLATYTFAFSTVLPEQRWADWLQVNDRVVVEAAAIPAESFVVDVPEPTDAELSAFFVTKAPIDGKPYNEREPLPEQYAGVELPSPSPGFAVPRRIALQFLRADYDRFLAQVEEQVTEEEIEKFYEDNKDPHFIRADTELLDEQDAAAASSSTNDAAAGENADAPPADDAKPAKDTQDAAAPATNDQSSLDQRPHRSVFRLAAFADEKADSEAVSATDAAVQTAGDAASDAASTVAPESGASQPESAAEGSPHADAEKPKEFQPLDEVRDEIRRQVAGLKVSEQLEKLMNSLESQLNESYSAYFNASLDAEAEETEPPPPPAELADLSPLAQKHSLTYEKTAPLSVRELRDLPVGKSARPDEGNLPVYYSVFGRDVELYKPFISFDLDNNHYLVMKTSDTPGRVLELNEIRDEVVRTWKLQKAADLALKRAEERAAQAQSTGRSLEDLFSDDKAVSVIKTDPFSFFTIGTVSRETGQTTFRLSQPEGIAAAGPAFMEKVFGLGADEVGAVFNHDHSIAYVVRVVEHQDTPAELRQAFLSEADTWYGLSATFRGHQRQAVGALLADMQESVGLKWERTPDQPQSETE